MKKVTLTVLWMALLFSSFALQSTPSQAAPFSLGIEPIIGYERVRIVLPTIHTTNRLIYGARVTAGILLLSGEAEYIRGSNDESYDNTTQKNTADKFKLGIRSGLSLGPLFSVYLRGGVQAKQEKIEQTTDGITTTTQYGPTYNPYGGLGARGTLAGKISVFADVVAVIPSVNDLSQNEYQTTAGIAIKLP